LQGTFATTQQTPKDTSSYDQHREQELKKSGFTILRFWNNDVLRNMEGVLETIREALKSPLTLPSPARGEGKSKQ
jgi:very-short-patch-repair endonuclease